MCGLAGVARLDGANLGSETHDLVKRMARAVAHRGPDEERLLLHGPVALAFARLSLVDLVGGGQPLTDDGDNVVLIANGEIYNHRELATTLPAGTRLRTQSDCEVLIHLYLRDGLRFLDRVRGMFALVLWDRRRNQLLFARDRFGVKPLFYHLNTERVVFGSEMKALFEDAAVPRRLDWAGALTDQALTKAPMFSAAPVNTWFQDINLVDAGTIVTVDLGSGRSATHRYWSLPDYAGDGALSETEFVDRYRELLASSVDDCGMADVEIGLFLSGGIDSAAVAAFARRKNPLRTFTALNGSTLANGDAEGGQRIARMLDLPNHQILYDTDQTPSPEDWKHLLWLLESPVCGPEIYYKHHMYSYVRLAHPEIKAMMLGAGSDEFNGGYSPQIAAGGDWDDFLVNLRAMAGQRHRYANPDLAAWSEHFPLPLLREDALGTAPADSTDAYQQYFRWKYRDILQYNCWHEDRTAAGNGIESRVPFLDHRLVELVAAVPPSMRAGLVWDKRILRQAMRGILPDEVVERPKNPFFYGDGVRYTYRTFARMLTQQDGALIEEALAGPQAKEHIDGDNLRSLARQLAAEPEAGHVEFLLHLVNLGLLEQMAARPPAPPSVSRIDVQPCAVTVVDWNAERETVDRMTVRRPAVRPDAIPVLADNVMLLRSPADQENWYVVVDGAIEYVVDDADTPGWGGFLAALDGARTAQEVADVTRVPLTAVEELLSEAVDLRLVVISPSPAADELVLTATD
ncbi:asparagine synthase (glutamine-hydrolyzing) [Micromonospora marina]|uniref:asparagine synthase (glutamine-hydrolyzing) n=1 Tax=Micromonospora marina TaxID=307120 RepID=A0A1C5A914_9ACTN|nr:asparagine synthase (glutamine-hydrolyzing) [Micromonospora marina]SCF41649.1 asparagine synthase (glutamine-hydrolysing) [Micromonospora marina]